MSRYRGDSCLRCGRKRHEVEYISARGLCDICGKTAAETQQLEMSHMEGETLKRWRARTILSAGGILPPELEGYGD